MAHYIYCYYRVCGDKPGKTEVEFAVPTGACGNITGRLKMGIKLCETPEESCKRTLARRITQPRDRLFAIPVM